MTRVPREIGGYSLVRPLGEGGMASVYLALSKRAAGFSKLIVLKILRQSGQEDPELRRMFLDEARIAALLSHPNVVQTYEAGEDAGELYLAMEYLEGKALSQLYANDGFKDFDRDVHLRIISDGLLGLHYAHELSDVDGRALHVVHRDVSPQNLFVTYDGQAKLVDFGIAKISGSQKTESGVIKGKVAYIAPELLAGKTIDRRADVFAAGVMIWEALACRRLVPRNDDDMSALARRLEGRDPSIRKHATPGTPETLMAICEKAMAREPDDRYASALELHEALEGFLAAVQLERGAVARMMHTRFAKHRAASKKATEDALARGVQATTGDQAEHTSTLDVPTPRPTPYPLSTPNLGATRLMPPGPPSSRPGGSFAPPLSSRPISTVPAPVSHGRTDDVQVADVVAPPLPPKGLSTMTLAILGVLIGVGLAGVLFVWRGPTSTPARATAPTAPVAAARLTIELQPLTAVLTVDGSVYTAPYTRTVPKGSVVHVEARADGFAPATRDVRVDEDTTVALALAFLPAATSAPAPTSRPQAKPAPHTKPKPVGRTIDDGDPYRR